jgi:hypothetical protein
METAGDKDVHHRGQDRESAVAESYRRRYAEPDPEYEDLVARIGAVSAAACLAAGQD